MLPWVPFTNVSQFGPTVEPAMANIYTIIYIYMISKEIYYIDIRFFI